MVKKESSLFEENGLIGEYDQGFERTTVENRIKKERFMAQVALMAAFLMVFLGYLTSRTVEEDYVGGNVIYIGNDGGSPDGNFLITPWKSTSMYNSLLFSTLFSTDSTYTQVNPLLAEGIEEADDGLTYVITMGSDHFWSDGVPISVEDVLFSFESFLLCDEVNTYLSTAFHKIEGATAFSEGKTDRISGLYGEDNRIFITLTEPYRSFSLMLTQFVPLPKHILGDLDPTTLALEIDFFCDLNTISSGPFMLDSFDESGNLVLTKNPYFSLSTTDISEIVLLWDYENVELDYYTTTDPTKMISYRSMKGYEEYMVDVLFYRYFLFNTEKSYDDEKHLIMQDIRVRQAIYHALDVESLFNEVYFGKGSLFYGGSLSLAKEKYEYNPTKAIALLEEAGYDFQRTFDILYYSTDKSSYIFSEKVKEYLEAVGLTVELRKVVTASEIYDEGNYDLLMKNLAAFNIQDWYSEYLTSNPLMSQVFGDCSEFDRLYDDLNATTNSEDFDEVLTELIDLEQELLYKIPMFLIGEAVYINGNRLSVPDDIVFGNTRYFSDIRLDEWYVVQG